ncbi:MAG: HEAT repeat domain-containing protein [Alkalinema sp. CAN_BIN05]|nr:HEAT repeat domain-containing protein [Alkalinema sp. CAN_BIN05]
MSITRESVQILLSSADFGDRLRGVNQLRELDRSVSFQMIQPIVQDSNVRVRYAAMSQLSTLGHENPTRTLEMLRVGIKDPEADVQAAAADCIGALHLVEAYPELRQLYISTSDWIVQMSIVATLGELGEPLAIEILESAINSGTELLIVSAIGALGELKDERAIVILEPFAQNPDSQIRYRVAQALAYFPNSIEAKVILNTMVNDSEALVSEYAKELVG